MGNKLSCSCAPLIRKAYRYEDSPWQTSRRRDGHLLRLWAEVFHVSSNTGTIKWQQVSEDLVPVNIACIQNSPEYVFHITAYNSQVDKILDVRLVQPGTRIGQASECFVYWKDPMTEDTWGLNFTSSIDAKQFKECCSPSFKFSRKASSSYSLKLDPPNKQKIKTKRKPLSTPASPSRSREPQCTCMTAEQYARLRAQDPRYRSSTLPRAQTRATETDAGVRSEKVTAATSSTSLYDNVASGKQQTARSTGTGETPISTRDRSIQQQTDSGTMTTPSGKQTSKNHVGSQVTQTQSSEDRGEQTVEKCRSEGTQAGGTLSQMQMQTMHKNQANKNRDHHHILTSTRSMDYDMDLVRDSHHHNNINNNNNNNVMNNMINNNQNNNTIINNRRNKSMSKSTDDMREGQRDLNLDSNTLKRMLKPMTSNESPATSPEMTRRRYASSNYYNTHHQPHHQHQYREHHTNNRNVMSDVEGTPRGHHKQIITDRDRSTRFSGSRSSHEIGRGYSNRMGGLYLELERNGGPPPDMSPPSDNVLFDNQCYATTPSSSNGNSDLEQPTSNYRSHQPPSAPGSPTSRLLHEYEMHLRNTLAKGMDAESYSLHTFEALLSQSMENLEFAESLPSSTPRSPYTSRRRPGSSASTKSSTLPPLHRLSIDRPTSRAARDREGYYSDRNELIRERERERERERGYLSDHNSSSRCASCLGESSRAQWFRHSDGWRSGSSTFGSGTGSVTMSQSSMSGHKRSPWDSLPSLRHDNSRDDSGYKSARADSFEQRSSLFDRQDSLRSDYISDRESRYGMVHQASIESADSRLCYLTSSEACHPAEYDPEIPGFGWSSLETIQTALNDKGNFDDGTCKSVANCESNNPSCKICKQQSLSRRRKKLMDTGRRKKSSRGGDGGSGKGGVETSKSLPSELQYEPNVQELFSFIESVLSSWFVEDGAYTSQGESENDDKSKSFERDGSGGGGSGEADEEGNAAPEEDKGDESKDEEDVFQITIEKQQKKDRRKAARKADDKEFKEISFELNYGTDSAEERNDASGNNNNNNSNVANENLTSKQIIVRKCRRGSRPRIETENGRMNMRIRELVLRVNAIPDGSTRFRHSHWAITVERCNYVFLRKMSDEDRMSLTTAVSDEEDAESVHNSPYRAKQTGTAAASFNCTGAVRKAGFLSVKKWLLRKKHQIELARKRGWKGYWVCLKGTTLLFYPCDSREGRSVEAAPKHLIIVDGAIMQPIPEHPKRDYIFCLSTAFGDAYLFQAPCQVELENWVNSIHCACAAAFARHRGKTGTLHLLQEEIFRLEKAIESDHKLKHMADLQQSVVSDPDTKQQIHAQIVQWEENLERLHCEQFRLRCYMASLHNGELPNPKSLLTHVSRATKNTLNKLGVFTVSSFHAFICARSPSLLNNLLAGRGATKRRPPMLSRSNSGSSRRGLQMNSKDDPEKSVKVSVPDNQTAHVYIRDAMSVEEFLASACSRKNLNPMEHFVRVKKRRDMEDHNYFVPHRTDMIETYLHTHEIVEVCAKILYQVELQRTTLEQMWGFSVEAELIENADKQDELCCYVSRVEDKSVAMQNGIIKGDEIMVINGAIVSDLDMMYLESVLQEELALCMMMRSSRTEPPDLTGMMRSTDDMIESLVCPPPPSDPPVISEEMISGLIVPAPAWSKELYSPEEQDSSPAPSSDVPKTTSRTNSFEIENLLKTAEQVTGFCRSPQETRKSSPTGSIVSQQSQAFFTPSRQLTHAEKLRKVILELVDTERTYVEHLNNLLENYLEPLKKETFLSNAEINALFGNIQEIVTFQRLFLQNLEEALEAEPDFHKFEHPSQFKNVLFSIGSAFLYYVNHFKLYSSFCASHSKAQKVLHPNEGNQALQEFLAARNPKQQHSSTLESYLIKPIQRILKYPLLLQQLRNLTDPQSNQHQHLIEALKGMEKVAEHINEMQRIHEEYGAIFDHLFRQHQKSCKQPIDLSPGDLLYYGGVEWLNISDFLGKIKKGLELHAMCFVFKSAVVFLCKERLRQKKKLMGVSSKSSSSEVEIIRYQVLIPVTEVQVRASSAKDMDSHFLWELIHLRSQLHRRSEKVYVLSNSTADFRNAFLKTIRQIIRESVRNMSIPATKSGQPALNGTLTLPKPPPRDFSISSKGSTSSAGSKESTQRSYPQQPPQSSQQQIQPRQGSQTLKPRKPKPPQRHSAGNMEYDNTDGEEGPVTTFRSRSKTVSDTPDESHGEKSKSDLDPGTKSEGEEDSQCGIISGKKTLGKTPNHLTLSTTSTLSAGSTGSQAKLIQSSHHPENYQPSQVKDLGSPVWKPRDMTTFGEATTLPRHKGKMSVAPDPTSDRHSTPQGHGTTTRPGRGRKSIADVMMHENK